MKNYSMTGACASQNAQGDQALRRRAWSIQLLQALILDDKAFRLQFCTEMQHHLEEDCFPGNLIFSDEATFHLHGKVNRHNVRIWGTEKPHVAIEHIEILRNGTFAVPFPTRRCMDNFS